MIELDRKTSTTIETSAETTNGNLERQLERSTTRFTSTPFGNQNQKRQPRFHYASQVWFFFSSFWSRFSCFWTNSFFICEICNMLYQKRYLSLGSNIEMAASSMFVNVQKMWDEAVKFVAHFRSPLVLVHSPVPLKLSCIFFSDNAGGDGGLLMFFRWVEWLAEAAGLCIGDGSGEDGWLLSC